MQDEPGDVQDAPEVVSPIRDPRCLGPTEDLEREPDGIPHDVVWWMVAGVIALSVAAFAAIVCFGWLAAIAVVAVALPVMVFVLQRRSERERDHVHRSR